MFDGFIKVAAATPNVKVADCGFNGEDLARIAQEAAKAGVKVLVTPELGITGYTCGDLFLQDTLLEEAENALVELCKATEALPLLMAVGLPVRHRGKLYNCAALLREGRVLGLVPKSYPPNYSEFYELRHFTPAFAGVERIESGLLRGVPIGVQLLFRCASLPALTIGVEICEDLWVPAAPSLFHAAAGATLILNPSASSETVGKAAWRRSLVSQQSGKLVCAYAYADAGYGESSTDLVFAGHNLIAENGAVLAESKLFSNGLTVTDVDTGRLMHDRQRMNTFPDGGSDGYLTIGFSLPLEATPLTRAVSPAPFVPADEDTLAERCETILAIQAQGLRKRLVHTGCGTLVLGVSGGLDSSLSLLVCARAIRGMNRSMTDILAVTMPGFGTTARTKGNAEKLCEALGVSLLDIDITKTTRAHFEDIGQNEATQDVTYENAQARIRTLTLMDLANQRGGLVVGTGDLSELALGWATYNGDQMSMYNPNAAIPKTLIRYLIAYEASLHAELHEVLRDILNTPVSPELLPPKDGQISQKTEHIVGPYELHDFFLYQVLRWGFAPRKVYRLAQAAFARKYDGETIKGWLRLFYKRFFSQQFKRSCLPDGPKVGSVTLSPRGDWRMPSDASAAAWLEEVEAL